MIIVGGSPEDWGSFVPRRGRSRPAKEQFNEHCIGVGTASPVSPSIAPLTLKYPGDPPYHIISVMTFRNGRILFSERLILILQPDGTIEDGLMDDQPNHLLYTNWCNHRHASERRCLGRAQWAHLHQAQVGPRADHTHAYWRRPVS